MRSPKGWGNQTHAIWLCVPCDIRLHGSKEIDFHFNNRHPGHKPFYELFGLKELIRLPNCPFIIADCRRERNFTFKVN